MFRLLSLLLPLAPVSFSPIVEMTSSALTEYTTLTKSLKMDIARRISLVDLVLSTTIVRLLNTATLANVPTTRTVEDNSVAHPWEKQHCKSQIPSTVCETDAIAVVPNKQMLPISVIPTLSLSVFIPLAHPRR